jgi:hypothetical protein
LVEVCTFFVSIFKQLCRYLLILLLVNFLWNMRKLNWIDLSILIKPRLSWQF